MVLSTFANLVSATAHNDGEIGLGIRSSRLLRLSAGWYLPSLPDRASIYAQVVVGYFQEVLTIMKVRIKIIGTLLLILYAVVSYGQANKEMALAKAQEAIKLMDNGEVDESIKLLQQAQKLDPERFDYSYELAYAHYLKEDFNGAIIILDQLKRHKDVTDRLFQLLGNSYDILGKSDKAFEIYDEGLITFPNSGLIYLEKGNVYWNKKEYEKALPFYERGIEVDPTFPSNYYRATRIYCGSTEEVWGMVYGEIFMNLERGSKRTSEISKLLFDTYKTEIKFTSDTSLTTSFCQQATVAVAPISKTVKLPFCFIYEPTLLMSIDFEKNITINSLDKIRTAFVQNYFKMGHDRTHPNILFEYQDKILKAGHLEAYNHWILMKGDEDEFDSWELANKEKWSGFVKWFSDNGLAVSNSNKFFRGQY